MIDQARLKNDPILPTARYEGPDLVVRTLEIYPRRRGRFV